MPNLDGCETSCCFCAGNLYSREVQVDGEQVTIQVQDTPGVEVSFLWSSTPSDDSLFSLEQLNSM